MNNIRRLAFIGGGNMAAALIGGLTKRGLSRDRIVVADPSALQLERLVRDYGITTAPSNEGAVADAEVVVLAVKPQQMRAVALGIAPRLAQSNPLVISVAAGIPLLEIPNAVLVLFGAAIVPKLGRSVIGRPDGGSPNISRAADLAGRRRNRRSANALRGAGWAAARPG